MTDHSFLWAARPTHKNDVLSRLTVPVCAQTALWLFRLVGPIHPHQLFGWDSSSGTSSSTNPCPHSKCHLHPAPPPQPSLLTCWAAPASAFTASDLPPILSSPSFHCSWVFSFLYFVTRPIIQYKEDLLVMSLQLTQLSTLSSLVFLAPCDLQCLSFTHLTVFLPFSLVLDLQDQAGIFLHLPSLWPHSLWCPDL